MQEIQSIEISEYLDRYLATTRLSMNQVAKRWGVSSAILSQIKNNKKAAGLDLGLKILRESGASLREKETWMKSRFDGSEEAMKVFYDSEKKREELRLRSQLSERFENNSFLMDIFLDISLMQDEGLSSQAIIIEYGKRGLSHASSLVETGLIELKDGKFYRVLHGMPTGLTPESSFQYMKHLFGELKDRFIQKKFKGEFHMELSDVSEETYMEIKKMQLSFNKEILKKIKENEMPRIKGGKRIIFQSLISVLKILILSTVLISNTDEVKANGVTGGASGITTSALESVYRAHYDSSVFLGKRWPRKTNIRSVGERVEINYTKGALRSVEFKSKEAAINFAILLNQQISKESLSIPEIIRMINTKFPVNCKWRHQVLRDFDEFKIEAVGFKVEKHFSPTGEERFRTLNNFFFPCMDED